MEYQNGTIYGVYINGDEVKNQTRVLFCNTGIIIERLNKLDSPNYKIGGAVYRIDIRIEDDIVFTGKFNCSFISINAACESAVTKIYYFGESEFLEKQFTSDDCSDRTSNMLLRKILENLEKRK